MSSNSFAELLINLDSPPKCDATMFPISFFLKRWQSWQASDGTASALLSGPCYWFQKIQTAYHGWREKILKRINDKLPIINNRHKPRIAPAKIHKYLLCSSIPAAQNKSRTFEKDYETRPADVNPDDDPTFKNQASTSKGSSSMVLEQPRVSTKSLINGAWKYLLTSPSKCLKGEILQSGRPGSIRWVVERSQHALACHQLISTEATYSVLGQKSANIFKPHSSMTLYWPLAVLRPLMSCLLRCWPVFLKVGSSSGFTSAGLVS